MMETSSRVVTVTGGGLVRPERNIRILLGRLMLLAIWAIPIPPMPAVVYALRYTFKPDCHWMRTAMWWMALCIPPAPIGLSAVATSPTSVNLTWQANTEQDLAGYKIYRNGVVIETVGKLSSWTDNTASPGTTYTYELVAYNTPARIASEATRRL